MDPNRITHGDLYPATSAVGHSFVTTLDLQRIVGDFRDRHDVARAQRSGEAASHVTSVTDYGDVIVVSDFLSLGAANHEVVQRVIDDFRDKVRLLSRRVAAEWIGHRARLIYQKNDASRICARDLGRIHFAILLLTVPGKARINAE